MKDIKNEIRTMIDEIDDEELLEAVFTMLSEQKAIGFNADGTPISKEQFKKRVKAASERVKSGDYISHEAVKQETEKRQSE